MNFAKDDILRHFKGKLYKVVSYARCAETQQTVILYESLEDGMLWTRRASAFDDIVYYDGANPVKRFEKLLTAN